MKKGIDMEDILLLIPTYNPQDQLVDYIKHLKKSGFHQIMVVNDGSSAQYNKIFNSLEKLSVDLFVHAKNLGKGRALKNAMNKILLYYPNIKAIITIDSDGQHAVDDVLNIAKKIQEKKDDKTLYLGVRDFNEKNVPFKSKAGNKITSFVYHLLFGQKITDTQTGLRGIPISFLRDFMDLEGERFEYEINKLIYATRTRKNIKEIKIQTLYFNDNSETHFRPFSDSLKIYGIMFKVFFGNKILPCLLYLIELIIFAGIFKILYALPITVEVIIWTATAIPRGISIISYLLIQQKLKKHGVRKPIFKNGIFLWFIELFISAFLLTTFILDHENIMVGKVFTDMIFFVLGVCIIRDKGDYR